MKLVGIVDIHSKIDRLEDVLADVEDADLALIAGDITNFGRAEEAEKVLRPLLDVGTPLFAVTGNCDHPEVDQYLIDQDIHLEGKPRVIDGLGIVGFGGSLPCPGTTPHEHSEEEISESLANDFSTLKECDAHIAVIHQPPLETAVDKSTMAGHVGSTAVREYLLREKPRLLFSGHIHESRAIDELGETTLVNPGPFLKGYYFTGDLSGDESPRLELHRL